MTPLRQTQKIDSSSFSFFDLHPPMDDLFSEIFRGLRKKQKSISPKFFYDQTGSNLFYQITQLPEYYPTKIENSLLPRVALDLSEEFSDPCQMIEYGCGNLGKVSNLLNHWKTVKAYSAIDISKEALLELCSSLNQEYPNLEMYGICADFTSVIKLPSQLRIKEGKKIAFFPGSSIGNFEPFDAFLFLRNIRKTVGIKGSLLIGVDLKKDSSILHAAYNDSAGITARFNLNLLQRINRECGTNFNLSSFQHQAFYNETEGRIEMHLISLEDQKILLGTEEIDFKKGETIHTENSYKYTLQQFEALASNAGWKTIGSWTDPLNLFGIFYLSYS